MTLTAFDWSAVIIGIVFGIWLIVSEIAWEHGKRIGSPVKSYFNLYVLFSAFWERTLTLVNVLHPKTWEEREIESRRQDIKDMEAVKRNIAELEEIDRIEAEMFKEPAPRKRVNPDLTFLQEASAAASISLEDIYRKEPYIKPTDDRIFIHGEGKEMEMLLDSKGYRIPYIQEEYTTVDAGGHMYIHEDIIVKPPFGETLHMNKSEFKDLVKNDPKNLYVSEELINRNNGENIYKNQIEHVDFISRDYKAVQFDGSIRKENEIRNLAGDKVKYWPSHLCFINNDRPERIYYGDYIVKSVTGRIFHMSNAEFKELISNDWGYASIPGTHIVKSGETIVDIAHLYDMTLIRLINLNNLQKGIPTVGTELKIEFKTTHVY